MASLDGVHPETARRVRRLLADPALGGRYGITSSVRTYEQQKRLYLRYKAGVGNLAANPDRTLTTGPAWPYDWKPKGSWHMVQADGYGHAVDLHKPWNHTRARARALVHPLLPTYGLKATVPSEWWHVQALTSNGWVNEPPMPLPNLPDLDEMEDEMIALIDTETNEGWLVAGNRARPLTDVAGWLATWNGPTYGSKSMRYVIGDLYDLVG